MTLSFISQDSHTNQYVTAHFFDFDKSGFISMRQAQNRWHISIYLDICNKSLLQVFIFKFKTIK
jgi:hypothetical protein